MKGTVLAVETGPLLRRAALLRDGVLDALEIDDLSNRSPQPGAIYRCRITRTIPGIGAAVADMGDGQTGFFPEGAAFSPGQSLLAEVRREADGDKAARLSPAIQLRSDHLVFTPARPGINVSRKITDKAERTRLRTALDAFASKGGFVIRTEARDSPAPDLHEEARILTERYDRLAADATPGQRAPAPDAVARIMHKTDTIGSILADEASLDGLPPVPVPRLDAGPFDTLDIDAAIASLMGPRHKLPEGWLSIDPTPALIAVDVNTGAASNGNATLRVNLDAASALPRLLSLKKIGGLILIDFAGAPKGSERARIAEAFGRAAAHYLDGSTVFGWGPAGLLEAVCRRPGRSLALLMPEDPR